jgi:hypothetical protein
VSRCVLLIVSVFALVGCASDEAPPQELDVSAGTYGGVGIGSSTADVRAKFGAGESAPDGPAAPLEDEHSEIGAALSIPFPEEARVGTRDILRYDDVAFLIIEDRVFALVATEGEPIGDELESVRQSYAVECGTTEGGGEYREYPYCVGKLGEGRYVWFGDYPIRSVTVSATSLLGGA